MAKTKKPVSPTPLIIPTDHAHYISALCFLPGGRFLLSGSFDFTVRLWNLRTGAEEVRWTMGPSKWAVTALALSPDGYTLAAMSEAARDSEKDYRQPLIVNLLALQRVFK